MSNDPEAIKKALNALIQFVSELKTQVEQDELKRPLINQKKVTL